MSGLVQPPTPRYSGFGGAGGGGGGGGSGTLITLTVADPVGIGSIVSLNSSSEAQLADPDLALSPGRYNVIGVAKTAGIAGDSIKFYSDVVSLAPVRMDAVYPATDNGKRIYLSTTAGEATTTPPPAGNAYVLIGILKGADGITQTPDVLLQFQVIALDT
jgi:hypothetical protein